MQYQEALREAFREMGVDLLRNPDRLMSCLYDLCDERSPELSVLERNCDNELLAPFAEVVDGSTRSSLELAGKRMVGILVYDRYVNADVASSICEGMVRALEEATNVPDSPSLDSGTIAIDQVEPPQRQTAVDQTPQPADGGPSNEVPSNGPVKKPRGRIVAFVGVAVLCIVAVSILVAKILGTNAGPAGENTGTTVASKDAAKTFVGCWQGYGWLNSDTDLACGADSSLSLSCLLVREDETAWMVFDKMGSPGEDGARPVVGETERQNYTWEADGEGIVLHLQEGVTAFGGQDVTVRYYPEQKTDYRDETILVEGAYIMGATSRERRAGWEKSINIGTHDVYQTRDLDAVIADDDLCRIRVVASGYGEIGTVGYVLEVTNRTNEEMYIHCPYPRGDEWTIAGSKAPDPDLLGSSIPASANGHSTSQLVFMSFFYSYSGTNIKTGAEVTTPGYDGDLDGFHDVDGVLEISLEESSTSRTYDFHA